MAQSNRTSKSSASPRKRSASASKPSASRAARSGSSRSGSSANGATANRKRASTSASRKRSTSKTSASQRSAANRSANGSGTLAKAAGAVTSTARRIRVPVLAGGAAVAVAGGALVKRQLAPKRRKVLGVTVPRPKMDGLLSGGLDLKPVAKGIASAGTRAAKTSQQLRKLSDDVERVGKTAQKMGDSLS
jgi:hypothetical protein